MSSLRRLHHEDQRRQLQPHELHRVCLSVLLAVYAGDHRRPLPQVPLGVKGHHGLQLGSTAL